MGVNYDLLAGASAFDAPGDRIDALSAALRRRWNFGEFDGRLGGLFLIAADRKEKIDGEQNG
jgi:hypothetical protein